MNKKNEPSDKQVDNAKHFFFKIEKAEIIKSINSLITNKATLEVWKKGESDNLVEQYIPIEFDDENMKLYLDKSGSFFDKMLKSTFIQSDVLFKGKNIEVDYLNGAVSKFGKKYGVKTPINEYIFRTLSLHNA